MTYTRLAVSPSDPARRDAVSAALFEAGAGGILEDGDRLVVVFETEATARTAEAAARVADSGAATVCEAYDPGDWNDAWRRGVRAHPVGGLVVAPPWLADSYPRDTTIVIDPGLGFGTGEHETTRLALRLLQEVVRAGDSVADVGCGSGVLALAAARLGAARVVALENDGQGVANAVENVERNALGDVVKVIEGDAAVLLPLLGPVRVIAANIIAPVLVALLPVFDRSLAPAGELVVGGVLTAERDQFVAAARAGGFVPVAEVSEGDWWSARLVRGPQ